MNFSNWSSRNRLEPRQVSRRTIVSADPHETLVVDMDAVLPSPAIHSRFPVRPSAWIKLPAASNTSTGGAAMAA